MHNVHTLALGHRLDAGEAWSNAIRERSQHGSLVLAGRLEFGQTNGVVQIWAHPDEDRTLVK